MKDIESKALALWGNQGNPLNSIIESAGSFGYVPNHCERCNKRFHWFRKRHTIYDKTAHKYHTWKFVCVDCINQETDAF